MSFGQEKTVDLKNGKTPMTKRKKPEFGYDGWAAVLVCMAVYSAAGYAIATDMPFAKTVAVIVSAWEGSVLVFTEKRTETYHKLLQSAARFIREYFMFIVQSILWMHDQTRLMIDEAETPRTDTIHFYIPIRSKTVKFTGQATNREVGLGWATGSYQLYYAEKLNERRLEKGIVVHGVSIPYHKRWLFWKDAGLKKQNTYVNGISVPSDIFQMWDDIK